MILLLALLGCRGGPAEVAAPLPYQERLVGEAEVGEELPLVVVIHGLGDVPTTMLTLLDGLPAPARVVAPQGLEAHGTGWSWFPTRVREGRLEVHSASMADAADQIVALIDHLEERYPTRGEPVVMGFSQGGMLAFTIATRHPDEVGLAIPVAGWLPPDLWPEGEAPDDAPHLVVMHGDSDPVVPLEPTMLVVEHLNATGWPVELHVFGGVDHVVPSQMHQALLDKVEAEVR